MVKNGESEASPFTVAITDSSETGQRGNKKEQKKKVRFLSGQAN